MSPSSPRDPASEERFCAWLAKRQPALAQQAPEGLSALAGLGGLEHEGAAFAQRLTEAGLDDERSERLLSLHAAWTRFRRSEREDARGVSWVGQASPTVGDEMVTWVESSAPAASAEPRGPAPSLLAPGARPLRPEVVERGLWRLSDLVVPLCLVAAAALLLIPVALEGLALRDLRFLALAQLREELSRGARPARLASQAGKAAWLVELRSGQLRAVNESCEGGPWCRERIARLSASRSLARELVADAASQGTRPVADWRPPQEVYTRELSRLQALLADVGGLSSEDPVTQRRALVLNAEIAWLRKEAAR